ncbi:MAG: MFS transporter, partial [Chloroflexota bacterium]|nr:MFS transporter [Chloroflexota bacterium]
MASSGPAPPSRPPGHGLGYLLLTLHLPSMAIGLGLGLTVPVIPELTQQMGIDLEGAALVFVFQLLGTFAAPLPTGFLIDKIGRRRVLLAGPIITGVASLLVAKVALDGADGSFVELLIYRFIAGWGEQMWTMSRITVIADTGASNQRGKQVTQMFGVQQIGNLSGPIVGGFAAVLLGLWAPFVMHAAIV